METKKRPRVLARFGAVILRTPSYARLATNLARDDRLATGQRARALGSLAYALSPIDLVPGLIPVVGQLDDLAMLVGGLRGVVRDCPPEIAREHMERSGLDLRTMDADMAALRATALWVAGKAVGLVGRVLVGSARLAVRAISRGVRG